MILREGCRATTGVPWIDEPGRDRVLVRLSRSAGLPAPFPDVLGLAVRVVGDSSNRGDLLLATTGTGALGRFLARPTHRIASSYSSLMPFRTPTGPLLLGALPLAEDGSRFELVCASLVGPWSRFAVLVVEAGWDDAPDLALSFDPVLNEVPGLHSYRWAARLRRFAYAASRRARDAAPATLSG